MLKTQLEFTIRPPPLPSSLPAFFRSRNDQAIVELALRQQLATYALKGPKPRLTSLGRTFWVFLSRIWSEWRENLVIVRPDTVVRWHRKGFRLYWRFISKRGPGRPPIPVEVQTLIRRFANENGWRARKVQAELEKLGISVGLATVSRYLPKRNPDRDQRQRWKTFLRNHRHGIAAMDFIVVPTVRFRLLCQRTAGVPGGRNFGLASIRTPKIYPYEGRPE